MTYPDDTEEAIDELEEQYGLGDDGPEEIIIEHSLVSTDEDGEVTAGEPEEVFKQRCYRNQFGEWQTEVLVDKRGRRADE